MEEEEGERGEFLVAVWGGEVGGWMEKKKAVGMSCCWTWQVGRKAWVCR